MDRPARPVRVFVSYSSADRTHLKKLRTHLSLLEQQGWIVPWTDQAFTAGDTWEPILLEKLRNAELVLLLVSADFIASPYIQSVEMVEILNRHARGEVRVVPILVRPCDLAKSPLERLQVLPLDRKPVTKWSDADSAWMSVVEALRKLLETWQPASPEQTSANPFYFGGMVLEPQHFIGRTREIQRLMTGLRKGSSWLLLGERRMGKSSLLWHLATVHLPEEVRLEPVYLDLQALEGCTRERWLSHVLSSLRERARAKGLEWRGGEPSASSTQLQEVCRAWSLAGHRPVLLLDEGERMSDPSAGFDRDFLAVLRSMANAGQLSLVIACQTSPALQLIDANGTSPWTNLCQTEYLGGWKREEAQALLRRGEPVLGERWQTWLLEVAGLWPALLQYAAGLAMQEAPNGDIQRVLLERQLRVETRGLLEDLWRHRSPVEQEVLTSVLFGRPVRERFPVEIDELCIRGLLIDDRGVLTVPGALWRGCVKQMSEQRGAPP